MTHKQGQFSEIQILGQSTQGYLNPIKRYCPIRHMASDSSADRPRFRCEQCNKEFPSQLDQEQHFKIDHKVGQADTA